MFLALEDQQLVGDGFVDEHAPAAALDRLGGGGELAAGALHRSRSCRSAPRRGWPVSAACPDSWSARTACAGRGRCRGRPGCRLSAWIGRNRPALRAASSFWRAVVEPLHVGRMMLVVVKPQRLLVIQRLQGVVVVRQRGKTVFPVLIGRLQTRREATAAAMPCCPKNPWSKARMPGNAVDPNVSMSRKD